MGSSKMKLNALMIAAMAMSGNTFMASGKGDEMTIYLPPEEVAPAGTKTYWFDAFGNFSTEKMRRDEVVFKCFAINDKNAQRKYNSWKSANK